MKECGEQYIAKTIHINIEKFQRCFRDLYKKMIKELDIEVHWKLYSGIVNLYHQASIYEIKGNRTRPVYIQRDIGSKMLINISNSISNLISRWII